MKFHWLIIFIIANEIDPNYTFIDRLKSLKYSVENLANSLKNFESYIKITKWLIQLCHDMDSLLKLWNDVLFHNNEIDRNIFKNFIDQIRGCVFHDDAVALEYLDLILYPYLKVQTGNGQMKILLPFLHWSKDEVIQLLELISQSHTLELLNLFPEILNDCFRSDLTDTKEKKISECCVVWFNNFIDKLNLSNESDLIFSMFQRLELVHPLLSQRINIWQNLSDIAIERTKNCQENQIFDAINKMMLKNYS
ncbi:hypothetical protein RirG_224360 [Rhizophagus irregularis DAOM 197198w]|uniref:Uncharacterized protein n=1 Tax=Rhizophagus irregularis (strain DAOM 197198w) TaxID=1432141 RepID=A0A015K7X5_RHIIW|nr:hypothetical protein RirG_224360 [Rhizophagus irregularis DAOM 197198w]